MAVKIGTPELFKRVQTLKADMVSAQFHASPGQVELTDKFFVRIYNILLELEQEAFGDQK